MAVNRRKASESGRNGDGQTEGGRDGSMPRKHVASNTHMPRPGRGEIASGFRRSIGPRAGETGVASNSTRHRNKNKKTHTHTHTRQVTRRTTNGGGGGGRVSSKETLTLSRPPPHRIRKGCTASPFQRRLPPPSISFQSGRSLSVLPHASITTRSHQDTEPAPPPRALGTLTTFVHVSL